MTQISYDFINQAVLNHKYITFGLYDEVIFDLDHARTNWGFAKIIYNDWETGTVTLGWGKYYEDTDSYEFTRSYSVDANLTGVARDEAAYAVWLDFVIGYEEYQSSRSPYDALSAWSLEDMASNYLGFASYVNGSRNSHIEDISNALYDFAAFHTERGTFANFSRAFGAVNGGGLKTEEEAFVLGAYRKKSYSIYPLTTNQGESISWHDGFAPSSGPRLPVSIIETTIDRRECWYCYD